MAPGTGSAVLGESSGLEPDGRSPNASCRLLPQRHSTGRDQDENRVVNDTQLAETGRRSAKVTLHRRRPRPRLFFIPSRPVPVPTCPCLSLPVGPKRTEERVGCSCEVGRQAPGASGPREARTRKARRRRRARLTRRGTGGLKTDQNGAVHVVLRKPACSGG
jgi:hypothetical protein